MLFFKRKRQKKQAFIKAILKCQLISDEGRKSLIAASRWKWTRMYKNKKRVMLNKGSFVFNPNHRADWSVFKEVFIQNDYSTDFENAYLVDIGAHRGMFSAYGLASGAIGVISYEPVADNYTYLESTLAGFKNFPVSVDAKRCAVGARAGVTTFYVYRQSWSHSTVKRVDKKPIRKEDVVVVSLQEVILAARARHSGKVIVKIDAEGAEFDMLLSTSVQSLSKADEFFIETHRYVDIDPVLIEKHLNAAGFKLIGSVSPDKSRHNLLHMISTGNGVLQT